LVDSALSSAVSLRPRSGLRTRRQRAIRADRSNAVHVVEG
jgi:hypothetical protein